MISWVVIEKDICYFKANDKKRCLLKVATNKTCHLCGIVPMKRCPDFMEAPEWA